MPGKDPRRIPDNQPQRGMSDGGPVCVAATNPNASEHTNEPPRATPNARRRKMQDTIEEIPAKAEMQMRTLNSAVVISCRT